MIANGIRIASTRAYQDITKAMLKVVIKLDPAAVIKTFDGAEGLFGKTISSVEGWEGRQPHTTLLQTVAPGKVDPTNNGVSQMVTAIFLKLERTDFLATNCRQSMSDALAQIMVQRKGISGHQPDDKVTELSNRYQRILRSAGGQTYWSTIRLHQRCGAGRSLTSPTIRSGMPRR
jgi:hypothetical protein